MNHPTTRVLALLELLQAQHRLTGVELADRLEVDERTVRRYVQHLIDLGIPVRADRGRYGGYRLRPGFKLPPLMFGDDEAVAVVLGLIAGRALGLTTTAGATATETALAKVQRVLPVGLRERIEAIEQTLGLTMPAREGRPPETAVVLGLAAAAHQGRRVRLTYDSWRGARSERMLDPYGLVVHGARWYVSGFDHRRAEVRTFRLDRIAELSPTDERFERPDDFDPAATVTEGLAAVPYAHEVEFVLRAPMSEVRRRVPVTVGRLTEIDGGVLVTARAERLDGMAQLLAGLGWPFEIRRPDELKDAVRDLAARLRTYAG